MRTVVMNTEELMKGLGNEKTTVFVSWKTHGDYLPVAANKESLLENLQHQFETYGNQDFSVMVKEQTRRMFEVDWVEGVELYLL